MDNYTNTSIEDATTNILRRQLSSFGLKHRNIFLGVVGIALNVTSIILLMVSRKVKVALKIPLISLVFNDLTFVINLLGSGTLEAVRTTNDPNCWLSIYHGLTSIIVSYLSILLLAIHNYVAVFYPLKCNEIFSTTRSFVLTLVCWILGFSVGLACVGIEFPQRRVCIALTPLSLYGVAGIGGTCMLCAAFVSFINVKIFIKVKESNRTLQAALDPSTSSSYLSRRTVSGTGNCQTHSRFLAWTSNTYHSGSSHENTEISTGATATVTQRSRCHQVGSTSKPVSTSLVTARRIFAQPATQTPTHLFCVQSSELDIEQSTSNKDRVLPPSAEQLEPRGSLSTPEHTSPSDGPSDGPQQKEPRKEAIRNSPHQDRNIRKENVGISLFIPVPAYNIAEGEERLDERKCSILGTKKGTGKMTSSRSPGVLTNGGLSENERPGPATTQVEPSSKTYDLLTPTYIPEDRQIPRSSISGRRVHGPTRTSSRAKTRNTLTILTLWCCFLTLPFIIYMVIIVAGGAQRQTFGISHGGMFLSSLVTINAITNPLLYAWRFVAWRLVFAKVTRNTARALSCLHNT